MRDRRARDEQAARLVANRERQNQHGVAVVEGEAGSCTSSGSLASETCCVDLVATRGASRRRLVETCHSPSSPDEAATRRAARRPAGRAGRSRALRRALGQPRSAASLTCSRPPAATSSTPGPPQRELARGRPLLLAHEAGHAGDDEQEEERRRDDQDEHVGVAERLVERGRRARSGRRLRAARDGAASAACASRAQAPRACASRGGAPPRPRAGSRRSSRRRSSAGGCTRP